MIKLNIHGEECTLDVATLTHYSVSAKWVKWRLAYRTNEMPSHVLHCDWLLPN